MCIPSKAVKWSRNQHHAGMTFCEHWHVGSHTPLKLCPDNLGFLATPLMAKWLKLWTEKSHASSNPRYLPGKVFLEGLRKMISTFTNPFFPHLLVEPGKTKSQLSNSKSSHFANRECGTFPLHETRAKITSFISVGLKAFKNILSNMFQIFHFPI